MSQGAGFDNVDEHRLAAAMLQGMRDTARWPAVVQLRAATWPLLAEVPADGAVLDVGCGLADVLSELKAARPDVRAVGVDVSDLMLRAASEDAAARGVEVELSRGAADDLELDDDTFDVVRSERMLQWTPDPERALREMVRVTRPGGHLIAIDTDWRTLAMELPDRQLERAAAGSLLVRPSAGVGGRLRNLVLDQGLQDVREHAATAVISAWDPASAPAPPGFLPPFAIAEEMVAAGGVAPEVADAFVETFTDAARRDRLHVSVSIFAVTARIPT